MNTDAARARNARKRLKLRVKARGDGPTLLRMRCITAVEIPRECALSQEEIDRTNMIYYSTLQPGQKPEVMQLADASEFTAPRIFHSGERLFTKHEVSEADILFWRVYAQNIFDSFPSDFPCHFRLEAERCGQKGAKEWRGTVEEVAAAVVAAVGEVCTHLR